MFIDCFSIYDDPFLRWHNPHVVTYFLTAHWLPSDCTVTAQKMPGNCAATVRQLHRNSMATLQWLHLNMLLFS